MKRERLSSGEERQAPLSEEKIVEALPGGALIGRKIKILEKVDSTNSVAMGLARAGMAPDGTVLLADAQEAGRGRFGRRWFSPAGVNIYLSIVLCPSRSSAQSVLLPLAFGCASVRAVAQACGVRPRLKWPNDLMFEGKKLGGLLVEADGALNIVVVGIGINVNCRSFPPDLPAISLATILGMPVDRNLLVRFLLVEAEAEYARWREGRHQEMLAEWESAAETLARLVQVETSAGIFQGWAEGISPDGALIVRTEGGKRMVRAGEVIHLRSGDS